jgi:hypothetical protein
LGLEIVDFALYREMAQPTQKSSWTYVCHRKPLHVNVRQSCGVGGDLAHFPNYQILLVLQILISLAQLYCANRLVFYLRLTSLALTEKP